MHILPSALLALTFILLPLASAFAVMERIGAIRAIAGTRLLWLTPMNEGIEARNRNPTAATQLSSSSVMQRKQITFIGNRRKSVAILAVAAGVGALGVCTLLFGHPLVGIVLVVASAVPVVVSLPVVVSPRSRYLHLDPSGFEVRVRRGRVRIEWADVTEFRWGLHHGAAVIEIEYAHHDSPGVCGHEPHTARIFDRYDAPLRYVMGKLVEWRLRYAPQR